MALSPVSKKSLSIRNIYFYNNDENTDMLCGKNSVAAVDFYNPMVDTFYINLIC
jgi:hypothetical protein